jgi:two-component sensor histidine kinase/PAS domain-containing protein
MFNDRSWRSFLVASVIMAAALAARALLETVLPASPPFITLYPAVALAGLLCGPTAGGTSLMVAVLAAIYFWIPPKMSFATPDATNSVTVGLFVLFSTIVLWASALLREEFKGVAVARAALDLGLDVGGVGVWEMDLRSRRITASTAARRFHAMSEEVAGTTPDDWLRGVDPADVEIARQRLGAAIAEGVLATYSYRVEGGPDGPRWINARGRVVAAPTGERLVVAMVDITEQIRVEQALRRERERLQLALEAGALAVWEYRPDTDEATIDTRYAVTLGLAPDIKVLSRAQVGASIHPDDLHRVAAEHDAGIASGGEYKIEYRALDPSGGIRWVMSRGRLIKGADEPDRLVGVIQDISEQKQREAELRDIALARELLVREADHRIKNSLQMVVSLMMLSMRGLEAGSAAEQTLRDAIARVKAIAASHLALQDSQDLKTVNLAVTLRELCAHFTELQPDCEIQCLAHESLFLSADRAIPLGLVISELITNALRHAFKGRAGGVVRVEARQDGEALVVAVVDDGVGMAARAGRSGLGSRIIRTMAAQIKARLDIDSTPGVGTTATLRLALSADHPRRDGLNPGAEVGEGQV